MKNRIKFFSILALSLFFLSSCEKDQDSPNITSADIDQIKSIIYNGEWKISYYFDSVKDETSDYQNFVFNFGVEGSLGATDGNVAVSGVWSITDDSSSSVDDDDSSDDIDFNIIFSAPEIFEELSDDWDILNYSVNKIELIDVSGGDGSTDYLTFQKL